MVLNWGDSTVSNPVNRFRQGGVWEGLVLLGSLSQTWLVSQQLLVLEVTHVRELVDTFVERLVVLLVVSLDVVIGLSEKLQSVSVFFLGSVGSVVGSYEVYEFSFGLSYFSGKECLGGGYLVYIQYGKCGNSTGYGESGKDFSGSHLNIIINKSKVN